MPYENDRPRSSREYQRRSDYSRERRRADHSYQERETREKYEAARARRELRNQEGRRRNQNRDLIDARGSIDSRAFNENHEIVGYSINKDDTHDPLIETHDASRWHSHNDRDGQKDRPRQRNLDNLGSSVTGRNQYVRRKEGFPGVIKFLLALIAVLLIILVVILFI